MKLKYSDINKTGTVLTFKIVLIDDEGFAQHNPISISVSGTINRGTIVTAIKSALEANDVALVALGVEDYLMEA